MIKNNNPYWTKNFDFAGTKKLLENTKITLDEIEKIYKNMKQNLEILKKTK